LCEADFAPAHVVFKEEGIITVVHFNVGMSDRSEMKVREMYDLITILSLLHKVYANDSSRTGSSGMEPKLQRGILDFLVSVRTNRASQKTFNICSFKDRL
jgi:hypothetical protein